jgi:hypothetical protein
VLKVLLNYAVSIEMIASNPAIGVKRYRKHGEGYHTWSEAEIAQFQAKHPIDTRPGLALALLLYTAQRRSARFTPTSRAEAGIGCSGRTAMASPLTCCQPMRTTSSRNNLTFLVTEYGKPFTAAGFGNWFRDQCNLAQLPRCSAHGLRKAAATRLANAGASTDQIKAVTGHRSLSEVERYTRAADQIRLARQALSIQLGSEREQKLSNLPARLDKKRSK